MDPAAPGQEALIPRPVKNKRPHEVPLPASLMKELFPVVRNALGLPAGASMQQVLNAQRAERLRRGRLASSPDRWWEVPVDPAEESWLFVDTTTGLPVRTELHNAYWHKVRRWVAKNDLPASGFSTCANRPRTATSKA